MTYFFRGSIFCAGLIFFLSGCATLSGLSLDRLKKAEAIADKAGLGSAVIQTSVFQIQSFARIEAPGRPLRVYIEGDGLAWRSRTGMSDDPTPIHPIALFLAAEDSSENVVYLARPCQYVTDTACESRFWTSDRFSEEVVASMNSAVDQYKQGAEATSIELVGFSGGAAIALLIAERREDVSSIRTVAGNLDPQALNRYHRVSPLINSLDPMKDAVKISGIPQWHFIGKKDTVVPPFIAENFKKSSGASQNIHIKLISGASHMDGWIERWRELLRNSG